MWGSSEEDQKSCKKIAAELKTTLRAISFSQIEWSHFTRSHFAKNCLKILILWSHFPPKQPNWNVLQHICKVGTPLSVGFMRVSGNKSWKPQQRPPPYYACYGSCVFRDSDVVVLLRFTSLCEECSDFTKSFRQSPCSVFLPQLCSIILSRSPAVLQLASEPLFCSAGLICVLL